MTPDIDLISAMIADRPEQLRQEYPFRKTNGTLVWVRLAALTDAQLSAIADELRASGEAQLATAQQMEGGAAND